jgi:hypothetical protein
MNGQTVANAAAVIDATNVVPARANHHPDPTNRLTSSSTGSRFAGRTTSGTIPERGGVTVNWGDAALEVAKCGGYDILRPRHPDAPIVSAYRGTPAYEPRREWLVPARYVPFDAPLAVTIDAAVEGIEHVYESPGRVEFEIDGRPQSPVVFADTPEHGLFALFTDATSGSRRTRRAAACSSTPRRRTAPSTSTSTGRRTCPAPTPTSRPARSRLRRTG